MIGMKVRYEITDVNLKITNVTLPKAEDSYVLLTASDEINSEIVFAISHEQAEYLENELYEANRRWKATAYTHTQSLEKNPSTTANNDDEITH
jgi:hypothetical protein